MEAVRQWGEWETVHLSLQCVWVRAWACRHLLHSAVMVPSGTQAQLLITRPSLQHWWPARTHSNTYTHTRSHTHAPTNTAFPTNFNPSGPPCSASQPLCVPRNWHTTCAHIKCKHETMYTRTELYSLCSYDVARKFYDMFMYVCVVWQMLICCRDGMVE